MIRTTTLLLLLTMGSLAIAQSPVVRYFIAMDPVDGNAMKYANMLVKAVDPEARLSFEGDRLKVSINAQYPLQEVLDALNSSGTIYIAEPTPDRSGATFPEGFPVRQDTGNTADDDANYAAAKRAWIEAHQAEYQRMLGTREAPSAPQQKQH